MHLNRLDSPFLKYLVEIDAVPGVRLPALSDISGELGISIGKLREELEVARSLGLVSVRTEDKFRLRKLVNQAWDKLRGEPIHIPNSEHRQLHLTIFGRLENPFVQGILAAYWDAYEASELTRFASYAYWVKVWTYHEQIVEALCNNNFEKSRQLLVEHFSLLRSLPATPDEFSVDGSQPQLSSQGEIR
jgi:DNA-binding FadR family transcriptional regulator